MEGYQDQMGGGQIEGVVVGLTFWLSLPLGLRPQILSSNLSATLRASDEAWLMMVYGRPCCNIVVLSEEVGKMGARTQLYIVPETTSAVLLLGEVGWTPSTSSD